MAIRNVQNRWTKAKLNGFHCYGSVKCLLFRQNLATFSEPNGKRFVLKTLTLRRYIFLNYNVR